MGVDEHDTVSAKVPCQLRLATEVRGSRFVGAVDCGCSVGGMSTIGARSKFSRGADPGSAGAGVLVSWCPGYGSAMLGAQCSRQERGLELHWRIERQGPSFLAVLLDQLLEQLDRRQKEHCLGNNNRKPLFECDVFPRERELFFIAETKS